MAVPKQTTKPTASRAPEKKKQEPGLKRAETPKKEPAKQAQKAPAPGEEEKSGGKPGQPPAYMQTKLAVSQPGDAAEQEADQVARQVARAPKGSLEPGVTPQKPEEKLAPKEAVPAAQGLKEDAPPSVAREAKGEADAEVAPQTEERLDARKGMGDPMSEAVKADLEARMGADFSKVRTHTDAEADELCRQHAARAFTVGSDVYFAAGEYQPGTDGGRELLAHELTHVVQQGDGVKRSLMRKPKAGAGKGKLSADGKQLLVPSLPLPAKPGMKAKFEAQYGGATNVKLKTAEERTDQVGDWKKQVQPSAAGWDLKDLIGPDNELPDSTGAAGKQYALKPKGSTSYLLGPEANIRDAGVLPWWTEEGKPHAFDVDHILELQLGGSADQLDNFQLLDAGANRSSGSRIKSAIDKAILGALPPAPPDGGTPSTVNTVEAAKAAWEIVYEKVTFDGTLGGTASKAWLATDVTGGKPLKSLEKATKSNAPDLYREDLLRLMPRPGAGLVFTTELAGAPGAETFKTPGTWGGLKVEGGTFNRTAGSGTVTIGMPAKKKAAASSQTLNFVSAGSATLCHIPPGAVDAAYRSAFKAKTLSPIVMREIGLDAGANFVGGGTLTIDGIPLFAGTTLDINIVGGDLVFSKTFNASEFKMKGPIQIDSCALTLAAGPETPIEASGLVEFHIGELAKGSLEGEATTTGFKLGGELVFDKELFTGTGRLDYDSDKGFKAKGTLGLKPGALKGVKKADFALAYDDASQAVDFSGTADLAVPGFKGASLKAHADAAGNIQLGGEAQLSDTIPRVKSGKLTVNASKTGEAWSFGGGGELEPDLEGLDASAKLALQYQDGLLTGKLTANYSKSILAGSVTLNAKAMVGGDGGESEPLKVWGAGTVSVTAAPWLKATVGLTVPEEGDISVSGELAIPAPLEVFPRKEVSKQILNVSVQIPIIPGIVAEVGGNVSATAGFGPATLEELKLGIEYTPANEDATRITGDASFKVPADAGLRLAARAGIGLGITGASATGGLEVGGTLGVKGAAEAGAHIDWTKQKGLVLDAEAKVYAEPSFKFDVSGYVAVTTLGFSIYDNRWELAAYEMGSGMRFGISFPVHYEEGQPFNVSTDDVKFEVPDIDPGALISQLGSQIF